MPKFKGHCQACLRKQAVMDRTGKMAKHGYQVAGYGYFHGTCNGSGQLPLEQETKILDNEVKLLKAEAAKLERRAKRAKKDPSVVKQVPVERRSQENRYKTEIVLMTKNEFIKELNRSKEQWDRAVESVIDKMERDAKFLRTFAGDLVENRDKIHGQELINVAATTPQKPEYEDRKMIFTFESTPLEIQARMRTPARAAAYDQAMNFLRSLYDNPNAKTKNVRRSTGHLQISKPIRIRTEKGKEWDGKTYGFRITWQQVKGTE